MHRRLADTGQRPGAAVPGGGRGLETDYLSETTYFVQHLVLTDVLTAGASFSGRGGGPDTDYLADERYRQRGQYDYAPPPGGYREAGPRGPPPGGGSPGGGGGGGEMDNFTKAVIAGAFIMGMGTGVWFNSEASVHKSNVASTEIIDRQTPNSEVCMANGYSSMVFDQRIFVSFNPCALRLVPAPCDLLHTCFRGIAGPGHRSLLISSPSLLVINLCALPQLPAPCFVCGCVTVDGGPCKKLTFGLVQNRAMDCSVQHCSTNLLFEHFWCYAWEGWSSGARGAA